MERFFQALLRAEARLTNGEPKRQVQRSLPVLHSETLIDSWKSICFNVFSRVHVLCRFMSVGPSVCPSEITSLFQAFRDERRSDLSYCPCPTTTLILPTLTRLMLPCIRPCLFFFLPELDVQTYQTVSESVVLLRFVFLIVRLQSISLIGKRARVAEVLLTGRGWLADPQAWLAFPQV